MGIVTIVSDVEKDIIVYETKNLYLAKISGKLQVMLNGNTHAVFVGSPTSIDKGKIFMEKAEKHIDRLRQMYNHY